MPDSTTELISRNDPAFLYLGLHPEEEIKAIVRHHWAGFLGTIVLVLAMALVPAFIIFAAKLGFAEIFEQLQTIILLLLSAYYLFLLTFIFGAWINYYYDIVFISNERIINVAQEGLLSRKISELSLVQVENVTAQVEGLLPNFFNYGLLIIETAGEGTSDNILPGIQGYFTITDVPDPNKLARLVLELHRQADAKTN